MPFVQIKGEFLDFEEFSMGARKKRIVAHFTDGTGYVDIVWFARAQQLTKNLKVGTEYIVFGKSRDRLGKRCGTLHYGNATLLQHYGEDEEGRDDIACCGEDYEKHARTHSA